MTRAERDFMLAVWDATLYARLSDSVSGKQYEEISELYCLVWPLVQYQLPIFTGYGA